MIFECPEENWCVLAFWGKKILLRASLFCVSWTIVLITSTSWTDTSPYSWFDPIASFIMRTFMDSFGLHIQPRIPILRHLTQSHLQSSYSYHDHRFQGGKVCTNLRGCYPVYHSYPLHLTWEHITCPSTIKSLTQFTTINSSRVPLSPVTFKIKFFFCVCLLNYLFKQ